MKKSILILILPIALAYSCKTTKKASVDSSTTVELISDESFRKPIRDKDLYKSTAEIIPLDTVYVTRDTLNIITKKINGCDAENFNLMWNGDLGKSLPAQTTLKLLQYVDGACKEKHRFHLTYNLTPLKLKGDTSEVKSTLIKVGGWARTTNYIHN